MKRTELLQKIIFKKAELTTIRGLSARVIEVNEDKLSGRVGEPGALSPKCDWDFDGKELTDKAWLDLKIDLAIKKIIEPLKERAAIKKKLLEEISKNRTKEKFQ